MASSTTMFAVTARRSLQRGKSIKLWQSTSLSASAYSRRSICTTAVVGSSAQNEPMHPNYTIDSIKPPKYWGKPDDDEEDPNFYHRKPVSSAHTIDLSSKPPKLSAKDSAALSPSGTVIHGRYGELSLQASQGIPLEYLALLHPAAEGAAALRQLNINSQNNKGTLLIYGASQPSAMSALQLASDQGIAVIGVAAGDHSGDSDFMDTLKSIVSEPGTILPEEYAIVKGAFRDIVNDCIHGDSAANMKNYNAQKFVSDFQQNLLDYAKYFPEDKLSPDPEDYTFSGKEKDREHWDANISAYLSQFPKGAPPIDEVILKEAFTKEQYAIFKSKFHKQTTAVITGDKDALDSFSPPDIVKQMTESPESISQLQDTSGEGYIPYEFSILNNNIQNGVDVPSGGPILGAIVAVTPDLAVAAKAVAAGKTLREKAEALQFLTESQKNAFAAFRSVVAMAKEAGKQVFVVGGSLPEFTTVEPSTDDVKEALSAMELAEDGSSRLNYFVQIYRASDYPVYTDYAIHRAKEEVPGPRQIIVTK